MDNLYHCEIGFIDQFRCNSTNCFGDSGNLIWPVSSLQVEIWHKVLVRMTQKIVLKQAKQSSVHRETVGTANNAQILNHEKSQKRARGNV